MSACKYESPKTIKDQDFLILFPWNCCIKEIVRCNGKVVELGRVDVIPDLLLSMGGRVIKTLHHSDNICFCIWTSIFVMGFMMYDPQLVYVPLLCSPKKRVQAYIQAYISKLEMHFRAGVLPVISGVLGLISSNRKGKTKKNAMEKFISFPTLDTQGKGVISLLTKTPQCVLSGWQLSSLRILCW